jgi:hypothetical protein
MGCDPTGTKKVKLWSCQNHLRGSEMPLPSSRTQPQPAKLSSRLVKPSGIISAGMLASMRDGLFSQILNLEMYDMSKFNFIG